MIHERKRRRPIAARTVTVEGVNAAGALVGGPFEANFDQLGADGDETFKYKWTAPGEPTTVTWTALVAALGDTNLDNNIKSAITVVP